MLAELSDRLHLRTRGYQILENLHGNFGRVLLVKDLQDGAKKVVKYPNPKIVCYYNFAEGGLRGFVDDDLPERIEHIETEIEVLRRLSGVKGIARMLEHSKIPVSWFYSLFNILCYNPRNEKYFSLSKKQARQQALEKMRRFVTCREVPMIVKQYIKGRQLGEGLGNRGYSNKIRWKENQEFLLNAIRAMHEKGINWKDPYERNIIITEDGKPWIVDIG